MRIRASGILAFISGAVTFKQGYETACSIWNYKNCVASAYSQNRIISLLMPKSCDKELHALFLAGTTCVLAGSLALCAIRKYRHVSSITPERVTQEGIKQEAVKQERRVNLNDFLPPSWHKGGVPN